MMIKGEIQQMKKQLHKLRSQDVTCEERVPGEGGLTLGL